MKFNKSAHQAQEQLRTCKSIFDLKDNYSVMPNVVERRKRQNRDRQRAWRERKRTVRESKPATTNASTPWQGFGILKATNQDDFVTTGTASSSSGYQVIPAYRTHTHPVKTGGPKRDRLIPSILPYMTDGTFAQSTSTIIFPLAPDHFLITLVQFNVVRAMIFNMSILSLLYCLPSACTRPFGVPVLDNIPPAEIPLDLQPTLLQKSTPHPFWISAIPFPAMRDNLILLAGTYDSNDLCYDLGQALYEGFDDVERRGCLVWGEPWRVSGWEITEGFVRKWGFLLHGCMNVIESTNYWREVRGEDKLIMEI